ncbi:MULTISPECIES: YciI family protein [unclassified Nocardiopsis]|uniref:YciI family protein n=1 Tax=Nocardiopsis TaxID=2013 RepID=UPI00387B2F14
MLHVLILRLTAAADEVAPHMPGHIAHLEEHHSAGLLLFSGRTVSADPGGVVLAVGERGDAEAVAARDPLVRNGLASYEIVSASPDRVAPELAARLGPSPASAAETPGSSRQWAVREYRRLRPDTADLLDALTGRPLDPVVHRAGTALLGVSGGNAPGAADVVRRCAAGLRGRGWAGDDLLADELEGREGTATAATELVPTPVNLEELADALDSDPAEGDASFDPLTGEVLPAAVLDLDADPDDDAFAEGRRIAVEPGSRAAYRDMAHFAETVADTGLRERLRWALEGRGAFGRFKNAMHGEDGDALASWTVFSGERALGRARRWLADHGYRPDERTAL